MVRHRFKNKKCLWFIKDIEKMYLLILLEFSFFKEKYVSFVPLFAVHGLDTKQMLKEQLLNKLALLEYLLYWLKTREYTNLDPTISDPVNLSFQHMNSSHIQKRKDIPRTNSSYCIDLPQFKLEFSVLCRYASETQLRWERICFVP